MKIQLRKYWPWKSAVKLEIVAVFPNNNWERLEIIIKTTD